MKILNKIRECLFDRKTDKEEEWEVPISKGGDANERYNKSGSTGEWAYSLGNAVINVSPT